MKDTIMIINSTPYRITDERSGEINEGVSFHYCMTGEFKPMQEENGFQGYRVLKGSVPIKNRAELRQVPGIYECEFDIVTDSKTGKAVLKPIGFKFAKALA